jgi:hypothetical protein
MYLTLLSIILGSLFVMMYYSIRMLGSMRRGLLEKSWSYLCWGAVLASVGVIIVGISTVGFPDGSARYAIMNTAGVLLSTVGVLSFAFGFRSHNAVFHPKGLTLTKTIEEPSVNTSNR